MCDKLKILHKDIVIHRPNKRLEIFPLSKDERDFLLELKRIFEISSITIAEENEKH